MMLIQLIDLPDLSDERGGLVVLESMQSIPFELKRIYYIFNNVQNLSRGFHAHKKLKQVAICLHGECGFVLDNGYSKEEVILSSPKKGLLIDSLMWREMYNFSDDCVLLILASEHYDESDYIRSYDEFLRIAKNAV